MFFQDTIRNCRVETKGEGKGREGEGGSKEGWGRVRRERGHKEGMGENERCEEGEEE